MLLDEVTAALDPETVEGVLVTIRELAEDGMTCMIVTHEVRARGRPSRLFTDGGVLLEHGPPKGFFASPRDPRTKQLWISPPGRFGSKALRAVPDAGCVSRSRFAHLSPARASG